MDRKSEAYRILPDREKRKLQAIAAAKTGGEAVVQAWMQALGDTEASARAEAVENLGFAWVAEAAPALLPLLSDADPDVRDRAAFALWRMRRVTLPLIREALRGGLPRSPGLLRLLVRLGREMGPELQAMLLEGDRESREFAASALCQIRNFDPELLQPVLRHPHLSRRIKAVEIMGHTGEPEVLLQLAHLREDSAEQIWTHKVEVSMRRILRRFPRESAVILTSHPGAFPEGLQKDM